MKRTFLILSILCLLFSCKNENKITYKGYTVYEKDWDDIEYYYCSGQRAAMLNDTLQVSDVYGGPNFDAYNKAFEIGYNDYKNGDIRIMFDSTTNKVYWIKSPWNDVNPWNIGITRFQEPILAVYKPEQQTINYLYKSGTKNNDKITTFDN
jgi:hypothetical protein